MAHRRKVFIVGSKMGVARIFQAHGWEVCSSIKEADLVQFTGGEDVSPSLYGEVAHPKTYCNPDRDAKERIVFDLCVKMGKPMAGICRGGQFLNVMCGGRLWQHVNNHASNGLHEVLDEESGEVFWATSTHHQMMIPNALGKVICTASESSFKENMKNGGIRSIYPGKHSYMDVEVVHYDKPKAFCFQPHPEYHGQDKLADIYFNYLDKYPLAKES